MTVDEELPRCLNNSVIIVLDGPFRDIAGFAECHTLHNIILSPFIGGFPLLFDFFLFDERGSVAIFINFNIPPLSLNNHVALFISFWHCSSDSPQGGADCPNPPGGAEAAQSRGGSDHLLDY